MTHVRRPFLLLLVLMTMATSALVFPVPAQAASGGTITYVGGYTIHTFTTSDTLVLDPGVTEVEVLVVAGGGGGGSGGGVTNLFRSGGGGGAGGLLYDAAYTITGPVAVTVGAGGTGGSGSSGGTNGTASVFGTMTAVGGGGGGTDTTDGSSGGSGGGGAGMIGGGSGGTSSAGQGNGGGYGQDSKAGGGGGAGAAGGNAAGSSAGAGGNGLSYPQFAPAGVGGYFAGGGGGGAGYFGYTAGTGGAGGGGGGGTNATGASATANTGSGGGGAGGTGTTGGNGGAGIVIVRYLTPANTIDVYNDVSLAIGPAILVAGQGQVTDIDTTATLDWTSAVEPPSTYNKITARIIGSLPAGLQLSVSTPLMAGDLVLDATDHDFITNIGNETQTGQVLTYTLTVTDWGNLFATTATLTIEYTITAQP